MKEYIDREALAADGWYLQRHINGDGHACVESMNILDIPSADVVEVRRGKWIEENTRPRSSQFCCSVCHRTAYDPQPTRVKDWKKRCRYAYCPNCGADMRGEENDAAD